MPRVVIYDAAGLNPAWTKDEVPGTKYGLRNNGWINTGLSEGWFVEHFFENAVSVRPLFLLLDGHSTHYSPQIIGLALEHDCIVLCLPPHTTHESQPLDVGAFAPLKRNGHRFVMNFTRRAVVELLPSSISLVFSLKSGIELSLP